MPPLVLVRCVSPAARDVFIVVLLTAACEAKRKIFLGSTTTRNFDTGILVRVVEKFFGNVD